MSPLEVSGPRHVRGRISLRSMAYEHLGRLQSFTSIPEAGGMGDRVQAACLAGGRGGRVLSPAPPSPPRRHHQGRRTPPPPPASPPGEEGGGGGANAPGGRAR